MGASDDSSGGGEGTVTAEGLIAEVRGGRRTRELRVHAIFARPPAPPSAPSPGMRYFRRLRRVRRRWRDAFERRIRRLPTVPGAQGEDDEPPAGAPEHPELAALEARRMRRRRQFGGATGLPVADAVEGAPESSSSAAIVATEAWVVSVNNGINAARIDGTAAEYGDAEAILDDLSEVGAACIRQPGETDLLFTKVFKGASGDELPLASEIRERLAERKEAFKVLLRRAWERGDELVLTMGTLGGGDEHVGQSEDGNVVNAIKVTWSHEHEGQVLDGNRFGYGGDPQFDILDTRDPYQRAWMERYALEACLMLREVEAQLKAEHPTFDLGDVVRGIELFNEIDARNIVKSDEWHAFGKGCWTATAERWAWLIQGMARQVRRRFPVGEIEVLLPGISSYNFNRDELAETTEMGNVRDDKNYLKTWTWRRHFLDVFLREYAILTPGANFEPSDIAHSLDLHWYHREQRSGAMPGPLHVSRLIYELGQVRGILDDHGFFGTDITVFESGVSAAPQEDTDDWLPETLPSVVGQPEEEVFQAIEVWRRLAGAAAGDARVVGWHSFESLHGAGNPFYGLGLRHDEEKVEDSRDARRRLSWYCYQRFASVLAAFTSCRLVLPTSADQPVSAYDDTDPSLDALVFEFREVHGSLGATPFAWLLLLDPWRGTEEVQVRATCSRRATVTRLSTVPKRLSTEGASLLDEGDLPGGSAVFLTFEGSRHVGRARYTLSPTGMPILLFSDRELEWEVVG